MLALGVHCMGGISLLQMAQLQGVLSHYVIESGPQTLCKGGLGAILEQGGHARLQVEQQAGKPVSATALATAAEPSAPAAAAEHVGRMTAAAGCLCWEHTARMDKITLCK